MSNMRRSDKIIIIVKMVVFALIFILLFSMASKLFVFPKDGIHDNRGRVRTFYAQPEDTIDVCLIGGSSIYQGWSSMQAWKNSGISSYAFSTASQASTLKNYIMTEVLKTQQPKVFLLDLRNHFKNRKSVQSSYGASIRRVVDNMPFSLNKVNAINYSLDVAKIKSKDHRFDWYSTFYRYHNRWDGKINEKDFVYSMNMTQGTLVGEQGLGVKAVASPVEIDEVATLDEFKKTTIADMIHFVKENNINAVFVAFPFSMEYEEACELNAFIEMLEENDMPYMNLNEAAVIEEIGIDFETDFFDKKHLNYWGSAKLTKWLGDYLVKNYALPDHRGDEKYAMWDEAETVYDTELKTYLDAVAK